MKILHLILILVCLFTLASCDKNEAQEYSRGYSDGWHESAKPTWSSSEKYKEGYKQAKQDAEVYDLGFYDGQNKNKCVYPKDPDYMEGFKDGSNNRKHRY